MVFLGISSNFENEGCDRKDLHLPGQQLQLGLAVAKAQPKTVIVLIHGGIVTIDALIGTPTAPGPAAAVLTAFYPGQQVPCPTPPPAPSLAGVSACIPAYMLPVSSSVPDPQSRTSRFRFPLPISASCGPSPCAFQCPPFASARSKHVTTPTPRLLAYFLAEHPPRPRVLKVSGPAELIWGQGPFL